MVKEETYSKFQHPWAKDLIRVERVSCSVVSDALQPHGLQPARLFHPWNSPGKNTGVSCHSLLQGGLPDPETNPRSPTCRQILYHLTHQGSPLDRVSPLNCLYRIQQSFSSPLSPVPTAKVPSNLLTSAYLQAVNMRTKKRLAFRVP